MPPTPKTEEKKRTLPAGDPDAGYVSSDLSFRDDAGTLPDAEQKWHDDRDEARAEQAKAIEEHEHKTATDRDAQAEKETKAQAEQEAPPKTSTKNG